MTSDILIGAGDIKFGDDDTSTQIARLFINPNTASATPNTVEIEGSGTGVLADIIGLTAVPSGPTAAASKAYVDATAGGSGNVTFVPGPNPIQTNSIALFGPNTTGTEITGDSGVTIVGGNLVATTGNLESSVGEVIAPTINVVGLAGNTKITSEAQAVDIPFKLPTVVGSNGSFLKTDGTGQLDWAIPSGLQFSQSAKLAEPPTGNNITLAPAPAQIDGVNVNIGDIVLLMAQTDPVENGLYERVGANLTRVTTGIYAIGSPGVVDAVTFVEDGVDQAGTSFVQTANPADVGNNPLAYSVFSTQADAKGVQFSIQYANPAGTFAGDGDFRWNTNQLLITNGGSPEITLDKTSGNITSVTGDISATAGSVTAGATVSAGTDIILGSTTFPTTLTTGATAAQSITLPDNSALGITTDYVLTVSGGIAPNFTTEWKDVSTIVPATDPAGNNTEIQFNNNGAFGASADFTWNDTTKNLGVTGTIGASGRITALEVKTTSDATLKTNITPLHNPLQQIKKIEGYSYNWKHDEQGPEMFGVLAQQLEEAGLSNIVSESYNGKKCVDYNQLIPLLLEGMKQMAKEIEELKK